MNRKPRASKLDIRHVLAVLAGMVCFAVVFMYTGNSDLLIAISSGLAVGAVSYGAAHIAVTLRGS